MLKELIVYVLLGVVSLSLFYDRSETASSVFQETIPTSASLKLITSVIEQSYCTNGDVRMSLRFRYTNTGSEKIILPRYSFEFSRYTISRSREEATKRHYEAEVHMFLTTIIDQPFPTRGREPSPNRFVILDPGQTYEVDTGPSQADLFIRKPALRVGSHVLQLSVRTWNESDDLAKELSVAWRGHGILWSQGIMSEPMPFVIEKPITKVECPVTSQ